MLSQKTILLQILLTSSLLICQSTSWTIPLQGTTALEKDGRNFDLLYFDVTMTNEGNHKQQVRKVKRNEKYQRRNDNLLPQPRVCGPSPPTSLIKGGEEAELEEIPWLANLEYKKDEKLVSVCAGNIINQRYILTAAHCLRGKTLLILGPVVSVRVGDHNTETLTDCDDSACIDPFQRLNVEKRVVHPDFRLDKKQRALHDIALLRTERDIQYSASVAPVCLPDAVPYLEPLKNGSKLTVGGWGETENHSTSPIKQKLRIPYWDDDECPLFLDYGQLCAGGVRGQDSCKGDSGGSLARVTAQGWFLVGIVSYGRRCGIKEPSIYTNVTTFMGWIHDNIEL